MIKLPTCLLITFMLFCFSTQSSALDLNDLLEIGGDIIDANKKVSTKEEVELGGNLISGLLGAAPLVDDPALQRYVNDVGFWVASRSERNKLPWRFGVIDSAGINAFAAPGGYIVITFGLFSLLENEAQLAAVLGHEISHVVKKHHLKALQKTMKRGIWGKIGVRALTDKDDHKKLDKIVNAGVQLYASGLDRDLEYDADKLGVVLAARAGYDPYALLDVLTTIDSINPDEADLTVMLNTHPPTAKRLNKLAELMDGRLDKYATGQINAERFVAIASGAID
ncbi:MAG: M48 family metalloprotease [Gammaproteobacteria bacterium]|nr:M48 family metalloprotease [Gammaproteobacteria bacterium]